jgi:hypothetical protein
MQLRYLNTLATIGTQNNTTIVFPFPVEFGDLLSGLGTSLRGSANAARSAPPSATRSAPPAASPAASPSAPAPASPTGRQPPPPPGRAAV